MPRTIKEFFIFFIMKNLIQIFFTLTSALVPNYQNFSDVEALKEKLDYYSKWRELPPDPMYPWKNFDFYLTKVNWKSSGVLGEPLCPDNSKPIGSWSIFSYIVFFLTYIFLHTNFSLTYFYILIFYVDFFNLIIFLTFFLTDISLHTYFCIRIFYIRIFSYDFLHFYLYIRLFTYVSFTYVFLHTYFLHTYLLHTYFSHTYFLYTYFLHRFFQLKKEITQRDFRDSYSKKRSQNSVDQIFVLCSRQTSERPKKKLEATGEKSRDK